MSAARIGEDGGVAQITPRPAVLDVFTAEDAGDAEKLARAINDLRKAAADGTRYRPRRFIEFETTVAGDGTTVTYLQHNFRGRVVYWVAETLAGAGGTPDLETHPDTDENTLALISWVVPATLVIHVEEAG